jgi:hypothetical protein
MRLVCESALQRNVAQGGIRMQHMLGGQFYATADHKSVGGLPEGTFKGAREVRFAAPNERAEICDEYRTSDMSINIVTHRACLPCLQSTSSVRTLPRGIRINPRSQQRSRLKYEVPRCAFVRKLTSGGIEQRNHMTYPFARSACSNLRNG